MRGQHTVSHDHLSWISTCPYPPLFRYRCHGRRRISSYKEIGVKFDGIMVGYAIIDAIDTIQIMGLEEEYTCAREWISSKLSFESDRNFNTLRWAHIIVSWQFGLTAGYQKTTIRILGGLLSAYHLSDEDPLYLEKSIDLAERIMPVFNTPSGLPLSMVNLHLRKEVDDPDNPGIVSTAEAATRQLEFRYLSFLTDNDRYWEAVELVRISLK